MSEEAQQPSQSVLAPPSTKSETPAPTECDETDDLMVRWEDHHKSFFELAEDLCHQEQFIDVTISCGDHNFPAHKLILSVCSPYFKNLFLRNPCKHPIVVLKDVHFKYMKLLLIFMYRGEVAVPQEDLSGLLKVSRSLQVRGLAEMGSPAPPISPRKRYLSEMMADSDIESRDEEFSIDDVKSKLHGQLDIQAVSAASPSSISRSTPPLSSWLSERVKYLPTSSSQFEDVAAAPRSSRSESGPTSEEEPHSQCKREVPDSWTVGDNGIEDHREDQPGRESQIKYEPPADNGHLDYKELLKRVQDRNESNKRKYERDPSQDRDLEAERSTARRSSSSSLASSSTLIDAARAAGLDLGSNNSDPMSSISALLAAAQATGGVPSSTPRQPQPKPQTTQPTPSPSAQSLTPAGPSQGLDLSNPAAAMANVNAQMQLYYYMQKLQTGGMGNPKERKECPICGKTLYDRSTWNRHMRIHTGEKPYPCRYCGRRFRTNYNKLGHEKKCPDRHARAIMQPAAADSASVIPSVVYR